jgi:DNA-binding IclR family transcriptional regulator
MESRRSSSASSPAPALARGIELLRLLGTHGPLSLDQAARHTRIPKASLLRLLKTLEAEGLARRRGSEYAAAAHIVNVPGSEPTFEARVEEALGRIATSTGLTSEWYVPSPAGMLLLKRAEPPSAEVEVKARVGFLRPWRGELDAVAAVGIASFGEESTSRAGHWTYVRDGVSGKLSAKAAELRIARARRDGYVVDEILNPNGVRRTACGLAGSGVIAVAGHFAPGNAGERRKHLQIILAETAKLRAALEPKAER